MRAASENFAGSNTLSVSWRGVGATSFATAPAAAATAAASAITMTAERLIARA